jgi:hypothetical protein
VQFLLGGSALIELSTRKPTPSHVWARDKPAQSLRTSVIGIGMARAALLALDSQLLRDRWLLALDHRVNEIQRESGRAIPIDERVIDKWALVYSLSLEREVIVKGSRRREPLGQDSRLEVAVALAYGLKLADPWEPFHDQLVEVGLGEHIESIR